MVQTKYGLVEGMQMDGCTVYMGIPYAKPPVGKLTFRHPVEPEPWKGVLRADHGSKNPVQRHDLFGHGNNSLDCLYLNIFVPEEGKDGVSEDAGMSGIFGESGCGETTHGFPKDAGISGISGGKLCGGEAKGLLPVMVWIYGGAFSMGAAGAKEEGSTNLAYNFCRFARETRTIVVTFNYRLNLYGFLNLSHLNPGFDRNNGLYDQIQALRFVQENIGAFGGNRDNVTVFGQSAGGASVLALMSMDDSKGLFHKAIVQSGVDHCSTLDESRIQTKLFLRKLGIRHLSELFTVPAERVVKACKSYSMAWILRGHFKCCFAPVVDGETLKDFPSKIAKERGIPLLIGNTEREGDLFVPMFPAPSVPVLALLLHLRVKKGKEPYKRRVSDALTDVAFVQPEMEVLEGYKGKAFRYVFRHAVPGSRLGAGHAADVPFELGVQKTLDGVDIPEDDHTGEELRERWARFAYYGDPGWEPYTENKETFVFE